MRGLSRIALGTLAAVFAAGCATSGLILDKQKELIPAGHGLVFGTISSKQPEPGTEYILKSTAIRLDIGKPGANASTGSLSTATKGIDHDGWYVPELVLSKAGMMNFLASTALPTGEYELYNRHFRAMAGRRLTASVGVEPPIRFIVKPGEIVYIGSHWFENKLVPAGLSATTKAPESVSAQTVNQFDQDYAMLLSVRPDAAKHAVTNALK